VHWQSPNGSVRPDPDARIRITGAPPISGLDFGFVLIWIGLDPTYRPPGPRFVGYGQSFGVADPAVADCCQGAPLNFSRFAQIDAKGTFATTPDIPGGVVAGQRLSLQAAWFDDSRPVMPLPFSNGLPLGWGRGQQQQRLLSR
jgi:hypothetical protein